MRCIVILACAACLLTSSAWADPYCAKCPNSCSELGLDSDDCEDIASGRGVCCVELTEHGREVVNAQDDALAEDDQPVQQEHCPSGFSPSERKCTPDEREEGCRDVRLPGGLGCVSR